MGTRHAKRILEINLTTDNSDNDIESIDSIYFYRNAQSFDAGNGFSVDGATAGSGESGTQSALGTSLGSSEVWIELNEVLPPPSVIVLDQATQA